MRKYTVVVHSAEEGGYWVEVPALPGTPSLKAAVDAAFADDGPLATAVDQFEPRVGQRAIYGPSPPSVKKEQLTYTSLRLVPAGRGERKPPFRDPSGR